MEFRTRISSYLVLVTWMYLHHSVEVHITAQDTQMTCPKQEVMSVLDSTATHYSTLLKMLLTSRQHQGTYSIAVQNIDGKLQITNKNGSCTYVYIFIWVNLLKTDSSHYLYTNLTYSKYLGNSHYWSLVRWNYKITLFFMFSLYCIS